MRGRLASSLFVLASCVGPTPSPDGGIDAGPPHVAATHEVDLLVLWENGGSNPSTAFTLNELTRAIGGALLSGDRDDDGTIDFAPVRSLHVAFVTSDMGVGDVPGVLGCEPGTSDDGSFQTMVRYRGTDECPADFVTLYPDRVLSFDDASAISADDFAQSLGCLPFDPQLRDRGCGYEQPLEAVLKAITPSAPAAWTAVDYEVPTFADGTRGHGADPATNGAFLRPDSVLVILMVAAVDDCSTPNDRIFSTDAPFGSVDSNTPRRCTAFADELYAIDRYVDGLVGLRRFPSRVVYLLVGGIPATLSGEDPTTILADPSMVQMFDPMSGISIPVCSSSSGYARPTGRLTRVAEGVLARGGHATAHSLCTVDSSRDAPMAMIDTIASALAGTR